LEPLGKLLLPIGDIKRVERIIGISLVAHGRPPSEGLDDEGIDLLNRTRCPRRSTSSILNPAPIQA
jgi:hypothetical protein